MDVEDICYVPFTYLSLCVLGFMVIAGWGAAVAKIAWRAIKPVLVATLRAVGRAVLRFLWLVVRFVCCALGKLEWRYVFWENIHEIERARRGLSTVGAVDGTSPVDEALGVDVYKFDDVNDFVPFDDFDIGFVGVDSPFSRPASIIDVPCIASAHLGFDDNGITSADDIDVTAVDWIVAGPTARPVTFRRREYTRAARWESDSPFSSVPSMLETPVAVYDGNVLFERNIAIVAGEHAGANAAAYTGMTCDEDINVDASGFAHLPLETTSEHARALLGSPYRTSTDSAPSLGSYGYNSRRSFDAFGRSSASLTTDPVYGGVYTGQPAAAVQSASKADGRAKGEWKGFKGLKNKVKGLAAKVSDKVTKVKQVKAW
jgi:hypothetical protein